MEAKRPLIIRIAWAQNDKTWNRLGFGWRRELMYRQGLCQTWGGHMAPINAASRRWLVYLGITGLIAFVAGWLGRRK